MSAYTVGSIALMATHSVGLTSEHAILIGLLCFAVVGKARPFVWDWLPFLTFVFGCPSISLHAWPSQFGDSAS